MIAKDPLQRKDAADYLEEYRGCYRCFYSFLLFVLFSLLFSFVCFVYAIVFFCLFCFRYCFILFLSLRRPVLDRFAFFVSIFIYLFNKLFIHLFVCLFIYLHY